MADPLKITIIFGEYKFAFRKYFGNDQIVELILYSCHKGFIFCRNTIPFKKWIIRVPPKQYWRHFKTLNSLTFTEFMRIPHIKFLHLDNFLELIRHCWKVDTHCQKHLADTLMNILFHEFLQMLVDNCRCTSSTLLIFQILIHTTELL